MTSSMPSGGSGTGIAALLDTTRVFIRNCSLQGMGIDGINCLSQCELAYLYITDNGENGIRCNNCIVINNVISNSTGFGLNNFAGSVAGGNLFRDNGAGNINGPVPFETTPNLCGTSAC